MQHPRTRRGQALVEFALVLPIILFVIVGGLGLGLILLNRMQLLHAAQEAAVVGATQGGCQSALGVVPRVLGYEPAGKECAEQGQMVEVTLSNPQQTLMPFLPENITVSARAVIREDTPSPTASASASASP